MHKKNIHNVEQTSCAHRDRMRTVGLVWVGWWWRAAGGKPENGRARERDGATTFLLNLQILQTILNQSISKILKIF